MPKGWCVKSAVLRQFTSPWYWYWYWRNHQKMVLGDCNHLQRAGHLPWKGTPGSTSTLLSHLQQLLLPHKLGGLMSDWGGRRARNVQLDGSKSYLRCLSLLGTPGKSLLPVAPGSTGWGGVGRTLFLKAASCNEQLQKSVLLPIGLGPISSAFSAHPTEAWAVAGRSNSFFGRNSCQEAPFFHRSLLGSTTFPWRGKWREPFKLPPPNFPALLEGNSCERCLQLACLGVKKSWHQLWP